jgi:hypothetical protein
MPSSSSHVATSLFVVLTVFAPSAAAATTQTPSCSIHGDADVYGLGIRLSFYLQWIASLLQLFLCPEASTSTRSAAVITVFAVFINTVRNLTADAETLVAVEWSILYSIMVCLFGSSTFLTKPMRDGLGSTGGSYTVLFALLAIYQIMSPYVAFDAWEQGRQPGCGAKFIFFASIDAYSLGWTIFIKISWTISALGMGAYFLAFAGYTLTKWMASWGISIASVDKVVAKVDGWLDEYHDESDDKDELWILRIGGVGLGAMGISFLEATIWKNNITFEDVHIADAGQLIPLLIGVFTLVGTAADAVKAGPRALRRRNRSQDQDVVLDGKKS